VAVAHNGGATGCGKDAGRKSPKPDFPTPLGNPEVSVPGRSNEMTEELKKSAAGLILLAWLVVGIPLGWGVYNTLLNSMKLFQAAPAGAAAPAVPPK
jgi:hypothetical protein